MAGLAELSTLYLSGGEHQFDRTGCIPDTLFSIKNNDLGKITGVLSCETNQGDRDVLIDLYNATSGGDWKDNTGWGSGQLATWHGVTVATGKSH